MNINANELKLIISALSNDRVGNWGDGRSEAIAELLTKLKSVKA